MENRLALPEPSSEEIERVKTVMKVLRRRIAASGGAIPFSEFMRIVLYEPGLGYYVGGRKHLGWKGDFVTAPELTHFFGLTVANQVVDLLGRSDSEEVLEAGAGSGALAAQILTEMERLDAKPRRYRILEVSPDLRDRQYRTLAHTVPHLLDRVTWLHDFPAGPWSGVILANELLDSLPVHRVRVTEKGVAELYVATDGEGFHWQEGPLSDPRIEEQMGNRPALPVGMETEVGLEASAWVTRASEHLQRGGMLLIDYGYPAAELYSPERSRGTLMAHYRHRAHEDPLCLPGVQDLTAHVDFSAIAEAGRSSGLEIGGFVPQAQFLINLGLTHRVEEVFAHERAKETERLQMATALKQLTLPGSMGERFKALLLVRGAEGPFLGFRQGDRRGIL